MARAPRKSGATCRPGRRPATAADQPARAAAPASLAALAAQAADCTRCPLYARATQTVFGEGPEHAAIALVGEQPGDREDVEGRPFVGPAGAVLARAIERSGLDRDQVFLTNAVKHFKWEARGKRRLHKGPSRTEIAACRYWLEEELALLQPRVTVALGATAGSSLFGPAFRVGQSRGRILQAEVGGWSGTVVATIHPSAVLRAKDAAVKEELTGQLVEDLRRAGEVAAG